MNEHKQPYEEPSEIPALTSEESNSVKMSQAQAALYYDTADSFLYDVGTELEKAISPFLPVQSQKILGGASPLLPVLEFIINYGPKAIAGTAGVFFLSTLKKLGENFADQLTNKLNRSKNDKTVLLIITLVSDTTTIRSTVKFDNYKTITDAIEATQQMINDAYEKRNTNLDQIQQGSAIFYRNEEGITVSRSNIQFHYHYDTVAHKWILENVHKLTK